MDKHDHEHCKISGLTSEQYCRLVDSMAQGVMYFNRDGKITWANPAAKSIFGYPGDELIGRSPLDSDWKAVYTDGTELAGDVSPSIITLRTGASIRGMVLGIYNAAEKRYRWVKFSTFPLFRPGDEQPVEACSTFEDITEEIELKQKLEEMYKKELEFSRLLQRSLLPDKLTAGEGYDLKTAYLPAFKRREIGGDIYDAFKTKTGEVAILIGDSSGKGIEAVFLAASTRSIIQAFAHESSSAAEALTRANVVLCAQQEQRSDSSAFTTVFIMILDPLTGNIRYSVAGHHPAMVRRVNGAIEFLDGNELPICVVSGYQYVEHQDNLGCGDKVLLYTDGLTEARRDKECMGEEGVIKILQSHGHLPPAELIRELMGAVENFTRGVRKDDTAIVVLERLGGS